MQQTIIQIGNSAGIVIPISIRQEIGLAIGDTVVLEKKNQNLVITRKKTKKDAWKVDAKFMKIVDEFAAKHKKALQELAKR